MRCCARAGHVPVGTGVSIAGGLPWERAGHRSCLVLLGLCVTAELSWAAAAAPEQTLRGLKGFEKSYNLKILL